MTVLGLDRLVGLVERLMLALVYELWSTAVVCLQDEVRSEL
jgi:hypothetical protein